MKLYRNVPAVGEKNLSIEYKCFYLFQPMFTKRPYNEVRDTFEWEYSGKTLFKRWTTIGVNQLGVWLQAYTNEQPYGFFEWKRIKEIRISAKDNLVYFVMYDMDSVYDNAVLYWPKVAFKMVIASQGNDKAICYPYRQDTLTAIRHAALRGWIKVVSI